jgi:endonuclease/exonuclease/phosphatase family metal-dependent hydrolase
LKVITFNVQFLPGIAGAFNTRPEPYYRAQTIGNHLAAYDIIGLNEVFEPAHRETLLGELKRGLGDNFYCVTPPAYEQTIFKVGSGLAIVSRFPIVASHSMVYGNDSSILKYGFGADGFAAKGALHAKVWRGGDSPEDDCLDVFVTHMESQESAAREAQYPKLAEFIRQHSAPGRPVLILGDFNTVGNPAEQRNPDSQYCRMMDDLRRGRPESPLIDLWPHFFHDIGGTSDDDDVPGRSDRIDYIFLSCPAKGPASVKPVAVRVNPFLDPRVKALSDHSAVEAELDWVWPRSS